MSCGLMAIELWRVNVYRYQYVDGYEDKGITENGGFQNTRRDRAHTNYYGVDSEPREYPDTDDEDVDDVNGRQDGMSFGKDCASNTYTHIYIHGERER